MILESIQWRAIRASFAMSEWVRERQMLIMVFPDWSKHGNSGSRSRSCYCGEGGG
jgi:hypothetical protein